MVAFDGYYDRHLLGTGSTCDDDGKSANASTLSRSLVSGADFLYCLGIFDIIGELGECWFALDAKSERTESVKCSFLNALDKELTDACH